MPKPPELGLRLKPSGIGFDLHMPSNVEDAVWEAVEQAIEDGWTAKRFREEVADAWREKLNDQAKEDYKTLTL